MIKSIQITLTVLFISLGINSVLAQNNTETLVVANEKVSCRSFAIQRCLQVRGEEDTRWQMLRTKIENFEFVPGYTYVLKVKLTPKSKNQYRLKEIVSRIKAIGVRPSETLESGVWQLKRLRGRSVQKSNLSLEFDGYKNRAFGMGSCNRFFSNYERNKNNLKFNQLGSTKKLCQNQMRLESAYFDNLRRVTKYNIIQNKLFLYAGNRIILEFESKTN